jgi:hypothetical protein
MELQNGAPSFRHVLLVGKKNAVIVPWYSRVPGYLLCKPVVLSTSYFNWRATFLWGNRDTFRCFGKVGMEDGFPFNQNKHFERKTVQVIFTFPFVSRQGLSLAKRILSNRKLSIVHSSNIYGWHVGGHSHKELQRGNSYTIAIKSHWMVKYYYSLRERE